MARINRADALINQALVIESESAQDAGSLGFMARAMVQATLPHKAVKGNEFIRKNGNYSLTIMSPSAVGLPYGSIPRLLLAWVTTEALRTDSRELELGDSMSAFMAELGLSRQGSNIASLKTQTRRLFASSIWATYKDRDKVIDTNYRLADQAVLWWGAKSPDQAGLWKSEVILSQPFFDEIKQHPIPVDMRALHALKRSPLALDIYMTLTHRASYQTKTSVIPWSGLAMAFGSDYAELRNFKTAFIAELKKVVTVYGAIRVNILPEGLEIRPSLTHISRKPKA
jgi:hypothetical protein